MAADFKLTSSVSKGCFVIRPTALKTKSRKRKHDDISNCFPEVHGESEEHRILRHELYTNTWKEIEKKVSTLQSNLNNHVFEVILEYINGSTTSKKTSKVKNEIPTGVFITGVNMPDHEVIFSDLVRRIFSVTPYVARFCSKNCPNIKSIFKETTTQIMETVCAVDEDSEKQSAKFLNRKGNMTMAIFSEWYEVQEKKRCHIGGSRLNAPVVLIFEDFESFQVKPLQDFITICSLYIDKLPIVLLFGVATIPAVVHQLLPRSVSSCLCIEKFHAQPAITFLLEVIDQVLINTNFSFKLGPNVFQFLYENFLFHDFSLQNFIFSLKFCMIDHFYSNPLSVLCGEGSAKILGKFSHEQLEIIRKCSSFQRFAEQQDQKELRLLLTDDKYTKTVVLKLIEDTKSYHEHFFPVLQCLSLLVSKLPGYPLGKKCRDVYECCLKANIQDVEAYHHAMKMAAFLAKDELVPILQECVSLLGSAIQKNSGTCEDFDDFIDAINEALLCFEKLSKQIANTKPPTKQVAAPTIASSAMANRFELQEKLKNAVYQKKKESPFEKNRDIAIATLDKLFQRYLLCPREQTLHEIFYYHAIETVKQRLSGCPRVGIQTALNNPHYYLNCSCCNIEPGSIQNTLPDISIAFKLHLECGRLINLYDWLQAFLTVTEAPVSQPDKQKDNIKKQELHARFIQAVSELQFLGFIKATKRKTDHVARLTWGNC